MLVEASVQDKNGRFVKSSDAAAFSVLRGRRAADARLARHEAVPATFALLDRQQPEHVAPASISCSGPRRPLARLHDAARSDDRGAVLERPLRHHRADRRPANGRRRDCARFGRRGGTAILDSLAQLARGSPGVEGRRAIVLITDGYDENSTTTFDEALAAREGSARRRSTSSPSAASPAFR